MALQDILFPRVYFIPILGMVMDFPKVQKSSKSIDPKQVAIGVLISCLTIFLVLLLCLFIAYLAMLAMHSI